MAENKPNFGPIGPGVLIDDLPIKDKRKVPSTIVQSLEVIRIKLGGDSSYTCDSVQESIDGITNIYDDKMPSSNSILSALNKLGKVIEPGSGGSSDFSTAEVTLSTTGDGSLQIASIFEDDIHTIVPFFIESFEAILYKGSQVCSVYEIMGTIAVSGAAVYDSEEQTITITGDCTITIS